jgi:hypothetical protein
MVFVYVASPLRFISFSEMNSESETVSGCGVRYLSIAFKQESVLFNSRVMVFCSVHLVVMKRMDNQNWNIIVIFILYNK